MQAKGPSPSARKRRIGNQGITRGNPDTLADAVNHPARKHHPPVSGKEQKQPSACRTGIAGNGDGLAPAQPV